MPVSSSIGSFRPYFERKSITVAAIYAGLTILVATLILFGVSKNVLGTMIPSKPIMIVMYFALSYVIGYALDVVIEKTDVFGPSLHPYYEVVGSGHWGAIAFVFSIVMSYTMQKTIVPLL